MDVYATEEEQVAAIKKWWKDNGTSIILGIVIGAAALFGWRGYQGEVNVKGEEASMAYSKIEKIADQDKDQLISEGEKFLVDYKDTPYASFTALKMAKVAVEKSDNESTIKYLQWVIDNSKEAELQQVAKMRLAHVNLNSGNVDAAWELIKGFDETNSSSSYHELKGDILMAQNKLADAKLAYLQATALNASGPSGNSFLEMKMDDLGR